MRRVAAFLVCAAFIAIPSARAQEKERVVASDYGYNAEDATSALQSAIDSGAKTVVVDKQSGPWIVTPLKLRGDLELVLEEGVEIQAKKGEFKALGDSLLHVDDAKNITIRGEGKGATLRMRKRDYWSAPYKKSEWRHGVSLRSVENATIENLQIAETGGDGVYLGTSNASNAPCRDVTIRNVDCVENNRQGISVINVDGLLIEDCLLRDTNGTAPAAGIDFEPNKADEQITNVVVRRVIANNNDGDGFAFYLPNLRAHGAELSFTLEDCDSVRNGGAGMSLTVANGENMRLPGAMTVRRTRFVGNRIGVSVRSKWSAGAPLLFQDALLVTQSADQLAGRASYQGASTRSELPANLARSAKTTSYSGFSLIATGNDVEANGGVEFDRAVIVDADPDATEAKPLLALRDASADGVGFSDVRGAVSTINLAKPELSFSATLDQATLDSLFPYMKVRRVATWNLASLNDEKEASRELAEAWRDHVQAKTNPIRLRGEATWYFYSSGNETVKMTFRRDKIGSYNAPPATAKLVKPDGSEETLDVSLTLGEPQTTEISTSLEGWYRLTVEFGSSSLALVSASAPVLTSAFPKADVFGSTGRVDFYVPKGAKDLGARVVGSPEERVTAKIFDPDGEEVAKLENVDLVATWTAPLDESGEVRPIKSGFWTIQFERPTVGTLEDYIFSVLGVPALLR